MKPLKLLGVAAFASLILSAATHNANACAAFDRADAILQGASGREQATALFEIRDAGRLVGGCEDIQIAIDWSAQLALGALCARAYRRFTADSDFTEEFRRRDQCAKKAVTDASFQSIGQCVEHVFRSYSEEEEAMLLDRPSLREAKIKTLNEKSQAAFDACMPAG